MKRSPLPQRLSFRDAAFANFERDAFPLHVGSVGIYAGRVPIPRFLAHVDRRIQLVPRYRQRLVEVPWSLHYPAWVEDPHFDLRNHVTTLTLPPPGSDQQLMQLAAEVFATPLRRDRPLWEIRLVQGLSGGRTAHIAKVHHCLVDGVAGVDLLGALLDLTPEPRHIRRRQRSATPPLPGPLTLTADALFDRALDEIRRNERLALDLLDPARATGRIGAVARALWAAGPYFAVPAQTTPWRLRLQAPGRLAWQSLPFDDVRGVATALGGTINDLALTLIAGGLARYLAHEGVRLDGRVVRAALPVNVRRGEHANSLGNHISFMLAGLPVGVAGARERFRVIHDEVAALKEQQQAAGIEELMDLLGELPPALHAFTGRTLTLPNLLTNLICTNVPGPLQPLYLLGHRMEDHYPWVPLGWRMGLSVAIMSYHTGLYFAVTADRKTPGDIDLITAGISDAFDELRAATTVPEPYRKTPSAPRPPAPARRAPVRAQAAAGAQPVT